MRSFPCEGTIESAARRFRALSNPARLQLLAALLHGRLTAAELGSQTDQAPSTVARHLVVLVREGFATRDGAPSNASYGIDDPAVTTLLDRVCGRLARECAAHESLLA